MKIGTLTLETVEADAAAVIAAIGRAPERIRELLAGPCLASDVARALTPFLAEAPSLATLAAAVAAHGIDAAKREVAKLYAALLEPALELTEPIGDASGTSEEGAADGEAQG